MLIDIQTKKHPCSVELHGCFRLMYGGIILCHTNIRRKLECSTCIFFFVIVDIVILRVARDDLEDAVDLEILLFGQRLDICFLVHKSFVC